MEAAIYLGMDWDKLAPTVWTPRQNALALYLEQDKLLHHLTDVSGAQSTVGILLRERSKTIVTRVSDVCTACLALL